MKGTDIRTNFGREITQLGATDKERATALGVSPRTITEYKKGQLPKILRVVASNPKLLSALLADLQEAA